MAIVSRSAADKASKQPGKAAASSAKAASVAVKPSAARHHTRSTDPGPASVFSKPPGLLDRLMGLLRRKKAVAPHPLMEDPARHIARIKREAAADSTEAAKLGTALRQVLDRHPTARSVLVHLNLVEKTLKKRGLKALDDLPPEVLQRAMAQLETLVSDWSPVPLAALRAKIKTIVLANERANDRRSTSQRLADFHDTKRVHVGEVSVTTFMEANAEWERSLTGQKLNAAIK